MKFRYRILAGFVLFILLSLILLIINLTFYQKTTNQMKFITQKIFNVNVNTQDCSEIIYRIQAEVWNTFLVDSPGFEKQKEMLDQYAGKFYENIRSINEITLENDAYHDLLNLFKNYYLFAGTFMVEVQKKGLRISQDAINKFMRNRDLLNEKLMLVYGGTRKDFEDALLSLEKNLNYAKLFIIITGAVILVLSIVVSLILAHRLTQPIEYLTAISTRIAEGDYDVRADSHASGEFKLLDEAFNNMAEHINVTLGSLKNAEHELIISHHFLDNIIHSLNSFIISIDDAYHIKLINHSAGRYFDLDEQNINGAVLWTVIPFLKTYTDEINTAIYKKVPWKISKVRLERKEIAFLDISVFPMRDERTDGVVIVLDDVTEGIKKDNQIRQMQKMETIGILSGGLAHDFNNILTVILNSNALIKEMLTSDKFDMDHILDLVAITESTVFKASELVKNLLTLTRKQELKFSYSDLNQVIKDVSKMCLRTFDKSVNIEAITYPEKALIYGDINQISQVLLNLCINAWHAMTIMRGSDQNMGGTLILELSKIDAGQLIIPHPQATGDSYWLISVKDTGIGMDEEVISHIFDPFYTTKAMGQGTGLGLAMVYNIIQLHKGFIEVSSFPGEGSTFLVYLPVNKELADDNHLENDDRFTGQGTVLVIDDEDLIRKTLGALLDLLGFTVSFAANGIDGINILRENTNDVSLIILDLSMPGLSGYETFQELRKINNKIPVLIHSGFKDDTKISRLLEEGAVGFLQKPYTLYDLSEQLKKILK